MAERHILLFSRPSCRAFVSLPAAGIKWSFPCCPAAGLWVSAPNLLTKIPAIFEKRGTPGQGSPFLAHFTLKSLLWRQGNRNWSRGGSDIDPRPRQLCQKGAASPRQGNKGGTSTAPAALSKGRVHGHGGLSKGGGHGLSRLTKRGILHPFTDTPPQSQIPDSMHPPLTPDNSGSWRIY